MAPIGSVHARSTPLHQRGFTRPKKTCCNSSKDTRKSPGDPIRFSIVFLAFSLLGWGVGSREVDRHVLFL